MDTYYNNKLRRIYNGNSVDDVLRYMSSLGQVDSCYNLEPKDTRIRRQKVKSPVSFNPVTMTGTVGTDKGVVPTPDPRVDPAEARHAASQIEKKPVASSSEPYPVYRGNGFKSPASTTQPVFKFTTVPNNKPAEVEAKVNKPSPKFEVFFRKPDPHPIPELPATPSKLPAFPPPTYAESSDNALAPPTKTVKVDSPVTEASTLVDRIMKDTGITDADKLIQMLKKLQVQEENDALMAKCPKPRCEATGNASSIFIDVEDVLQVIMPGARICNSDLSQLNNEIITELLGSDNDAETPGDLRYLINSKLNVHEIQVKRNNKPVTVYNFKSQHFPVMYNYLKKWASEHGDYILIA
jgi:hypothetical protein